MSKGSGSSNVGTLKLIITVDSKQAEQSLNQFTNSLTQVSKVTLPSVGKQFNEISSKTLPSVSKQLQNTDGALGFLNKQVDKSPQFFSKFNKELEGTNKLFVDSKAPMSKFSEQMNKQPGVMSRFFTALNDTSTSLGNMIGRVTGLIFPIVGLSASIQEAIGMEELKALSTDKLNRLEAERQKLIEAGLTGTREYALITKEITEAERGLAFTNRIVNLSWGDTIFFIATLTPQLLKLGGEAYTKLLAKTSELAIQNKTLSGVIKDKLINALSGLGNGFTGVEKGANTAGVAVKGFSKTVKLALIGTGIGAIIVGIGLALQFLAEKFNVFGDTGTENTEQVATSLTEFEDSTNGSLAATKALSSAITEQSDDLEKLEKAYIEHLKFASSYGKATEDVQKGLATLDQIAEKLLEDLNKGVFDVEPVDKYSNALDTANKKANPFLETLFGMFGIQTDLSKSYVDLDQAITHNKQRIDILNQSYSNGIVEVIQLKGALAQVGQLTPKITKAFDDYTIALLNASKDPTELNIVEVDLSYRKLIKTILENRDALINLQPEVKKDIEQKEELLGITDKNIDKNEEYLVSIENLNKIISDYSQETETATNLQDLFARAMVQTNGDIKQAMILVGNQIDLTKVKTEDFKKAAEDAHKNYNQTVKDTAETVEKEFTKIREEYDKLQQKAKEELQEGFIGLVDVQFQNVDIEKKLKKSIDRLGGKLETKIEARIDFEADKKEAEKRLRDFIGTLFTGDVDKGEFKFKIKPEIGGDIKNFENFGKEIIKIIDDSFTKTPEGFKNLKKQLQESIKSGGKLSLEELTKILNDPKNIQLLGSSFRELFDGIISLSGEAAAKLNSNLNQPLVDIQPNIEGFQVRWEDLMGEDGTFISALEEAGLQVNTIMGKDGTISLSITETAQTTDEKLAGEASESIESFAGTADEEGQTIIDKANEINLIFRFLALQADLYLNKTMSSILVQSRTHFGKWQSEVSAGMGLVGEAADEFADMVDEAFIDGVKRDAEDAAGAIEDLEKAIDNLPDSKTITIKIKVTGDDIPDVNARGFQGVLSHRQRFTAGEAGPELVSIIPLEKIGLVEDRVIDYRLNFENQLRSIGAATMPTPSIVSTSTPSNNDINIHVAPNIYLDGKQVSQTLASRLLQNIDANI